LPAAKFIERPLADAVAAVSRLLKTSAKSASSALNLVPLQCDGSITFCSQKGGQNAAM